MYDCPVVGIPNADFREIPMFGRFGNLGVGDYACYRALRVRPRRAANQASEKFNRISVGQHERPDQNVQTGVIFNAADKGRLKTRACADWIERRGFQTRLNTATNGRRRGRYKIRRGETAIDFSRLWKKPVCGARVVEPPV